ncbi:uncharacterized protein LOC129593475 [Paramacrobiotus metropolitanus]|uniref:uncharacterized protein LOC129593475 n=1 Tax=Paramacrobiotus metropolitanus TaxID=2943436 RepID=UPI002445901B|nr:uncharacterized protein LOC129593475 [Paramacrobiotus metropolitanus]
MPSTKKESGPAIWMPQPQQTAIWMPPQQIETAKWMSTLQKEIETAIRMPSQQQNELVIGKPVQVDKRSPQNGTASGNRRDGSATLRTAQQNERLPYCSEKVLAERRALRNAKIQQAMLNQKKPQNSTTEEDEEVHHSKFREYMEEHGILNHQRSPSVGKVQVKSKGASANAKGHGESAVLKGQETDLTLRTAQQKNSELAQQNSDDSLVDAVTLQRKEIWQKVAYRPNGNHGMWVPVTPKAKQKARMSQEDYWDMQQLRTQCERKRLEELVTGKPAQSNPVPVFNAEEYKKIFADWNYSRPTCQEEEFDEIPNFEDYKKEFDTKEPAIEIGQLFLQMVEQREKRLKVTSATANESAEPEVNVNVNRVKSWLPTVSDLKVTGLDAESKKQNEKVTGPDETKEIKDDLWETDKVTQALNECPIKLLRFPKQMKKR